MQGTSGSSNFFSVLLEAAQRRLLKAVAGSDFNLFQSRRSSLKGGISDSQGDPKKMLAAFRSIVFACINVRAKEVANSAAFLAQKSLSVDKVELLPYKHPLSSLIRNPNEYLTPFAFWYHVISHLDLTGNFYGWLAVDRLNIPRSIWPCPPDRVQIVPGDPKKGEPIILEYLVDWGGGEPDHVPASRMLHLRHPNPQDIYGFGGSLVMRAAYEIDIVDYALKFQRDYFENFGMPSYLVMYPNDMTPTVKKDLRKQWQDDFSKKAGGMLLLESAKDVKIEVLPVGESIAQLEQQGFNVATIRGVFGVPKSKLMDTETIEARATAEAMNYTFHRETIDPLLTMIEQQLTTDLVVPYWGEGLKVGHRNTVEKDPRLQAEIDNLKLQGGVTYINEIRLRDGLPPVEGGDEPLVSFSVEPLSRLTEEPNDQQDQTGQDDNEPDDAPPAKRRLSEASALLEKADDHLKLSEARLAALWKAGERYRARWEVRISKQIRGLMKDLEQEVIDKVRGKKAPVVQGPYFDVQAFIERLTALVGDQAAKVVEESFRRFLADHSIRGVVYLPNSPAIQSGLAELNAKTTTIPETLHDDLTRTMNQGIERKETVDQLAERVKVFFANNMDFRSIRIARTVSNYGINLGNRVAATDAGFAVKIWLTQRDSLVRDIHAAVDGQQVGIGQKFKLPNGDRLDVPGDPGAAQAESVVNCRCTAIYAKGKR